MTRLDLIRAVFQTSEVSVTTVFYKKNNRRVVVKVIGKYGYCRIVSPVFRTVQSAQSYLRMFPAPETDSYFSTRIENAQNGSTAGARRGPGAGSGDDDRTGVTLHSHWAQ